MISWHSESGRSWPLFDWAWLPFIPFFWSSPSSGDSSFCPPLKMAPSFWLGAWFAKLPRWRALARRLPSFPGSSCGKSFRKSRLWLIRKCWLWVFFDFLDCRLTELRFSLIRLRVTRSVRERFGRFILMNLPDRFCRMYSFLNRELATGG